MRHRDAAREDIRNRIRAIGGSEAEAQEAIAEADAKVLAAQERPDYYTFEDAAREVLEPWMTGERRPATDPFMEGAR